MNNVRLIFSVIIVAIGLLMLIGPLWLRDAGQRRYDRQLAARMARGNDAYSEELRALEAYPPPRTGRLHMAVGSALVLLGALIFFDRMSGL